MTSPSFGGRPGGGVPGATGGCARHRHPLVAARCSRARAAASPGNRGVAYGIATRWWPLGQRFKANSSTSSTLFTPLTFPGEQRSATPKVDEPGVARVAAHDRRVGVVAQCRLIQARAILVFNVPRARSLESGRRGYGQPQGTRGGQHPSLLFRDHYTHWPA